MIRHSTGRWYHGKRVYPGDPVEGTEAQKQTLIDCNQAYEDGDLDKPSMDNTKKEIEAWLDQEGIEYDEYATKSELLELI